MNDTPFVVVPWHDPVQRDRFLAAWRVPDPPPAWLVLQQDANRVGCAVTKNRGIAAALGRGAEIVVVLDDDCYPPDQDTDLASFAQWHALELAGATVPLYRAVTDPISRGTPYRERTVHMPVAAVMGFWTGVGDYDAPGQLIHGAATPMRFQTGPVFGRYFSLSGMNLCFRPKDWLPWCRFIDVPRFDDIWMGWLWQREAYRRGYCFSLRGPTVRHSRQSNVWANLRAEAVHLERNETLWREIATHPAHDYESLRRLLPC